MNQDNRACPYGKCESSVLPWMPARPWNTPAFSVSRALESGLILDSTRILDFGSGALRNSLFLQERLKNVQVFAHDYQATVDRFPQQYEQFRKRGGHIIGEAYRSKRFDIVLCTFVLETICTARLRNEILSSLKSCLKRKGCLVASFRGWKGVRGSEYTECAEGEGFLTPANTFIAPQSVSEITSTLHKCGFESVILLQNYRVDEPENVHLIAK